MGETVLDYNELAIRGVCVCNSDKRLVSVQIYRVLVILGKMLFVEKTVAFLCFLTAYPGRPSEMRLEAFSPERRVILHRNFQMHSKHTKNSLKRESY